VSRFITQDFVESYFRSEGCELLGKYVRSSKKMPYRCSCGNTAEISWNNFSRGRRCQNCLRRRRSGTSNYQWRFDREEKHLEYRWRQLAYRVLKQSGRKPSCSVLMCESLFGYSLEEFITHIKSQSSYSMERKWEIDHIFPVWAFVEAGVTDLKLINSLENLQVIPEADNSRKCYKFNPVAFVRWLESKGAIADGDGYSWV
jgi:hypothetical protein